MNKDIQFLIYNTPTQDVKVKAIIKDETIWLTQRGMQNFLMSIFQRYQSI